MTFYKTHNKDFLQDDFQSLHLLENKILLFDY